MSDPVPVRPPRGFTALGLFFFFGAVMATYAAITLVLPGTVLDRAWALNPAAHQELASLGRIVAVPFGVLAVALLLAGVGWFGRRYWGWVLGVALIATNLAGDVINVVRGERLKGAVGVAIAGLLIVYLTHSAVRRYFQ